MSLRSSATLAGVVVLSMPAPAQAMEAVVQDDQACVYRWHDRAPMLAGWGSMGGTHVRVNVLHLPGDQDGLTVHADLPAYDSCVAAIRAHGLTPQLTLLWRHQDDPTKIAKWVGEMADHFGPTVDRYSVLNEPDLEIPVGDDCGPQAVTEYQSTATLVTTSTGLRERIRYRGKVRRVVVRRKGRRTVTHRGMVSGKRVKLTRRGRTYWRVRDTRSTRSRADQTTSATYRLTARQGCRFAKRGEAYGRILRAAVPAIRAADPGAEVLAGETSPFPGAAVFAQNVGRIDADGWAHHCYDWDRQFVGTADMARASRLPVYCTEYGQLIPARPTGAQGAADDLVDGWDRNRAEGARQMSQYQWYRPHLSPDGYPWDTSAESVGAGSVLARAIGGARVA